MLAPAGTLFLLLLCLAATCLSIGLQGFYFPVGNNSYHIPIVEGWMDDQQFASDQFIQSLRYHTSYVWPVARAMTEWLDVFDTFFLLHVANRLAMLIGMAVLIRELGVRSMAGLSAAIMTLAVTRYLLSASGPGDHDLFMPSLNHSSLTWPFLFASLIFLVRKQIILSVAAQGPIFAINAFVAICGGPALIAGSLPIWPKARRERIAFLWRWAIGLGLAFAIAGTTILWIIDSILDQPKPEPFSFIGFLHIYYLNHWFITAASPRRLISFVLVAGCGAACLAMCGPRIRPLLYVWGAYLALFIMGAALPLLADSRLLLDLHPMRVGAGCVVMLSVIAIVAYLALVLEAEGPRLERLAAGLALLCFAIGQEALLIMTLCVFVVVVSRRSRWPCGRFLSPSIGWLPASGRRASRTRRRSWRWLPPGCWWWPASGRPTKLRPTTCRRLRPRGTRAFGCAIEPPSEA
ncbi:MAG: hypothetical protein WDN49_19995 [Acetobacteraceae bacterium]